MSRHNLWISVDNYKRTVFLKSEFKKLILRSVRSNRKVPYAKRYQAAFYLSLLPRFSSRSVVRNRCSVSGRFWSLNRRTRYSRFVFRSEAYSSNIPGCARASWLKLSYVIIDKLFNLAHNSVCLWESYLPILRFRNSRHSFSFLRKLLRPCIWLSRGLRCMSSSRSTCTLNPHLHGSRTSSSFRRMRSAQVRFRFHKILRKELKDHYL